MAGAPMNEERLRQVAVKRIKKRRDFLWHLVTYAIVNGFLVFIWAISGRGPFWPLWLMVTWGIGLAFHAWYAFSKQEVTETEVQAEMRRMQGDDG